MKNLLIITAVFATLFSVTSCQKQPEANFTISKTEAFTGDTIKFSNTTVNGDHYLWDFGDNNTSTDESPTHVYNKEGEYNVVLTAYSKKDKKNGKREQTVKIEKANEIDYDGNKYPISKVYVDIWGDYNGNFDYYHFNVSLVSDGITFTQDDVLGIGNIISSSMWSPSPTSIVLGTYTFASNYAAMSYNYGLIGLNYNVANNIGTSFECTGGSVEVAQDGTDYIFDMNYTLATGKIVKAHYKGILIFYDQTGETKNILSNNCRVYKIISEKELK